MSIVDFFEDAASKTWDFVEGAGEIAGAAAPFVMLVNPNVGIAMADGARYVDMADKHIDPDDGGSAQQADGAQQPNPADTPEAKAAREAQREAIRENAIRQTADDVTEARKKLTSGADIFTVLAEVIGPKLQQNIENLVDFAGTINTQSKDIFTDMAKLTGEQEKVKTSSAALGGILPAVGESMKNLSKG